MTSKRFWLLLNEYFDDVLSEQDKAKFKQELAESEDARRLFWEYAYQHAFTRDFFLEKEGRSSVRLLKSHVGGKRRSRMLFPILAAAAALMVGIGLFRFMAGDRALPSTGLVVSVRAIGQVHTEGDTFRTGPDSFARLDLADGSVVALDQNSAVALTRTGADGSIAAQHDKGRIYLDVTPQPRGFAVLSGASDIRIAGTRLMMEPDLYVAVLEGKVHVARSGETKDVDQGRLAVFKTETDNVAPDIRLIRAPFRADAFAWLKPLGLDPETILGEAGRTAPSGDLLALYVFDQNEGTLVRDVSGVGEPMDLTILKPENTEWTGDALRIKDPADIRYRGDATKLKEAWRKNRGLTHQIWARSPQVWDETTRKEQKITHFSIEKRFFMWWTMQFGGKPSDKISHNIVAYLDVQDRHVILSPFVGENSEKKVNITFLDRALNMHRYRDVFTFTLSPSAQHFIPEKDTPWRGDLVAYAIYGRAFSEQELKELYMTDIPSPRAPGNLPIQAGWAFE